MARPKKNYEPQKEELTKLAFHLFFTKGYENTTISDIMKSAGLTKAGMYHYFSSKEDILDAAIEYGLSQEIEKTKASMINMNTEQKMLHFIKGNMIPNDFLQKILQMKQENQGSYVAYRIRDYLTHAYIPLMIEILLEGNKKGIYKVKYPEQTAEFLVLLGKSLVEPNILPLAASEITILRMYAFLDIMEQWLNPTPEHANEIRDVFKETIPAL